MKALVTGGGGFLGRAIVEQLLQRGDNVTVFARGTYPFLAEAGVQLIRGDIQDFTAITRACKGMDAVFHVAAKAGLWGDWDNFYGVNVIGTENVINACLENQVPRLIYTSSPSVIFDGTDQCGVDEKVSYPARYENPYPHTKALGEQRILEANCPDLLTTSLRPHLIFGPRDNHLLPNLLARAREGKVPQVGDGTNKVDLTYVDDAARAHLLAANSLEPDSPVAGSAYFITQDEPVILWPWINSLLTALDIKPIRMKLPLWLARTAGALLVAVYRSLRLKGEPRITPFLASELAQNHYYNISRAKHDLGYQPAFTMAQATAMTIAWLKVNDAKQ
jgi:nucleoside-diphosphate-sugar epimerase